MPKSTISLILGGGKGTRLFPLTQYRSKPAVPLAGKYRIIDIPISNCINSGMNHIYLLTQFNSVSLHRHIRQTYSFDRFGGGFVEILAAQQTMDSMTWYQGTADAVRQHLRYIQQHGVDTVLILSGDQVYRMNYHNMLETHRKSGADVTIAAVPVSRDRADAFGIMRLDDSGRVEGFLEKPKTDEEIDLVKTDPAWIDAHGVESKGRDCLASMGIYLFNRDTLVELLEKTDYRDFGKEVFPLSIRVRKVQVHLFDGYWEDIGTIRSYYEANLELASREPPFLFADKQMPIFTQPLILPPTRNEQSTISHSLVADGCRIDGGTSIERSVVGLRSQLGRNVALRKSILMGADYYEDPPHRPGRPQVGVGDGSVIEGAIVDKNCRIGRNVKVIPTSDAMEDGQYGEVMVRDGVIVVPKDTVLPDGWSLAEQTRTDLPEF
ncbi:MAG: glucose-1-phosphate adenylyltransferase [Planctomycetaceae bacterium]